MPIEPSAAEQLDYLTFVDYAVERAERELPGVDVVAMRLVLTLSRAASALAYDLESSVHRPRGWSWPGFRVLFVLWLAGPLDGKRVAELAGMSRAAVSSLINTLERDGFVTRSQATADRRAVRLALTGPGRAAILGAFRAHNERERAWTGALDETERTVLIGLLDKLVAGSSDAAVKRRF